MLVSCSSDEGGESGNGPQATGQELERQLLDTHWKLAKEIKVDPFEYVLFLLFHTK